MAAEALDCAVYAFAARQVLRIDLAARGNTLQGVPPPPAPAVVRSSFVEQW
jgi:hypothetical protein